MAYHCPVLWRETSSDAAQPFLPLERFHPVLNPGRGLLAACIASPSPQSSMSKQYGDSGAYTDNGDGGRVMTSVFLTNLTSPPLLCFFLGLFAALARSDLDIPNPVARAVSLYLLFAIGFKGGVALSGSGLSSEVLVALGAALMLAAVVPVYVFFIVRRFVSSENAAAIAATYGSISAVTFVTATNYLDSLSVPWGGYFVAAMALMEAPAIAVGLYLYRRANAASRPAQSPEQLSAGGILHEALLNGSVVLILGALVIGWLSGEDGMAQLKPFVKAPFVGMLCIFLLDMGLVAARRLKDVLQPVKGARPLSPALLVVFAIGLALINGSVALTVATLAGLPEGDALLLTILGASASYIAVPAAMRLALPAANPGMYLTMALAITFPFNILVGIPLFHHAIRLVSGAVS